ncbi:MAG: hypothetical protein AABW59_03150 [archaeon]
MNKKVLLVFALLVFSTFCMADAIAPPAEPASIEPTADANEFFDPARDASDMPSNDLTIKDVRSEYTDFYTTLTSAIIIVAIVAFIMTNGLDTFLKW